MGIWDKVKRFFGAGPAAEEAEAAKVKRKKRKKKKGKNKGTGKAASAAVSPAQKIIAAVAADPPGPATREAVEAVAEAILKMASDKHLFAPGDIIKSDHRARIAALAALESKGLFDALGYIKTN